MHALSLPQRTRAQLWREARTQRSALLSLPLVILALVVSLVVLTRRDVISSEVGLLLSLLCSWIAALLILGSECVAGEIARGTLPSLERTPGGLRSSFYSKLCLYLFGIVSACLIGMFAFALFVEHNPWRATQMIARLGLDPISWLVLLPSLGFTLWVFAASAWSPSGVLAVPTATLLTLALVGVFWFTPRPFMQFAIHGEDALFFVPAYVVAGFLAARWSLVHGLAGSASRARSALVGIRASSFVLIPALLLVVFRPDVASITAGNVYLEVQWAVLSPNREKVYLVTNHRAGFMPLILRRHSAWKSMWDNLPLSEVQTDCAITVDLKDEGWSSLKLEPGPSHEAQLVDQVAAFKALERIPDLSAHGVSRDARAMLAQGLGRVIYQGPGSGKSLLWDPIRDLVVPYREHLATLRAQQVVIRRTDWLLKMRSKDDGGAFEWFCYDPDQGTMSKALGLDGATIPISLVVGDDRVLACDETGAFLVDPVTGIRRSLRLASGEVIEEVSCANWSILSFIQDQPVFFAATQAGWSLAILDPERDEVTLLSPPSLAQGPSRDGFIGRLKDGRIVAHLLDPARVVLIEPDGSSLEQVFP